jgi:hypothetical protein
MFKLSFFHLTGARGLPAKAGRGIALFTSVKLKFSKGIQYN